MTAVGEGALFSASIPVGQHFMCLVAPGVTLTEAVDRCRERGISVLAFSSDGDRWLFKVMAPEGSL